MLDINVDLIQWTSGETVKNENICKKEVAEELHKPIIKKFKERKVQSAFTSNNWDDDLADMNFISKINTRIYFLLCVTDIYSKYAWVIPLKDKKEITIANAFQSFLKESKRKSSKLWVDKGSEFYKKSIMS